MLKPCLSSALHGRTLLTTLICTLLCNGETDQQHSSPVSHACRVLIAILPFRRGIIRLVFIELRHLHEKGMSVSHACALIVICACLARCGRSYRRIFRRKPAPMLSSRGYGFVVQSSVSSRRCWYLGEPPPKYGPKVSTRYASPLRYVPCEEFPGLYCSWY
jgi:hypothetical protein